MPLTFDDMRPSEKKTEKTGALLHLNEALKSKIFFFVLKYISVISVKRKDFLKQ